MNLPRHICYRREHTIVAGIIPGPHELDSNNLQKYLEPLVDELIQLYAGQLIRTALFQSGRIFRAALVMIVCDAPAARKVKLVFIWL